jgi:hypothetical protein
MGPDLGLVVAGQIEPRMPSGLCQHAEAAWRSFWDDALCGVMRNPDASLVLRWVKNLDRYYRLMASADGEPIVTGSTGQYRVNPGYDLALKIEASIKADEQQLGIGPLNRLRLGVALSESAKSLADLNAEADEDEDDDPRAGLEILSS